MTILSIEPRVNGFRRASDVVVAQPPSSAKSPTTYTNGLSASPFTHAAPRPASPLLSRFIEQFHELEAYKYVDLVPAHTMTTSNGHATFVRHGKSIIIDGHNLSVPALVAVARHDAHILLNGSAEIRARIQKSRDVIVGKVETSQSVYGVSTGFGGSGRSFPRMSISGL